MAADPERPDSRDSIVDSLVSQVNKIVTDLGALKVNFDAHTHSGITAGAGVSGGPSAAMTAPTAGGVNPTALL